MNKPPISPLAPERFPDLPTVAGARFASVAAGLRYKQRHDLTLMAMDEGSAIAGVFTKSTTAGHPVTWCRRALRGGRVRAIIVNSGNANVFLGRDGDEAVRQEVEAVSRALGCTDEEVFVASTGVIGERLAADKIVGFVPELVKELNPASIADAAAAIMTTDTFPKGASCSAEIDDVKVTLTGIAKGSGMIAPDMATMLAFLFTDARLPHSVLQPLLEQSMDQSFNAITVDSDTSTSDTVLLSASGKADHSTIGDVNDPRLDAFRRALNSLTHDLALQIVRDGEGAQKLISVAVKGAVDDNAAKRVALAIGNSPLVKTAIAGGDANWGRVIMAVGKSYESIDLSKIAVRFGHVDVALEGAAVADLDEESVAHHLNGREINLQVTIGAGPGNATIWTCDLTHGYIDINADYRS